MNLEELISGGFDKVKTNPKGIQFTISGVRLLGYDAYKPSKSIVTIKYHNPTVFQYLLYNEFNQFEQEITEEQSDALVKWAEEQHFIAEQTKIEESKRLQAIYKTYQMAG